MTAVLLLSVLGLGVFARTASPPQRPQTSPFAIVVDRAAGYRATVLANGVLDDDALERAARSGLPLRLRYRAELWRDRLFNELVGQENWTAVLMFEPLDGHFTVHSPANPGAAVRFDAYHLATAAAEAPHALAVRPDGPGRYYYVASLEIETLSLSDLDELEHWLRGEVRPAVRGERSLTGAIGQGLKRFVIRILGVPSRRFEARSGTFQVT